MADKKVTVEIKVPEDFEPCVILTQVHQQDACPFTYWDSDYGCLECGYDLRDCPMKTMKELN